MRRGWLAAFLRRKTVPTGAEALICQAIITAPPSLQKALQHGHNGLRKMLDLDKGSQFGSGGKALATLAAPSTAKQATITTLGAVLAAWEADTDKHTWRHPTAWDGCVIAALVKWGYQPSDVEKLLLPKTKPQPKRKAEPKKAALADR